MSEIRFPLAPVAKPRMTRRDKWLKPPRAPVARYRQFADTLRLVAQGIHFELPDHGARFAFHVPMPPSWSRKRRREFDGKPCLSKPDLDNYLKAVFDSLRPDDCGIWHIAGAEKRWSERGAIVIEVEQAA